MLTTQYFDTTVADPNADPRDESLADISQAYPKIGLPPRTWFTRIKNSIITVLYVFTKNTTFSTPLFRGKTYKSTS